MTEEQRRADKPSGDASGESRRGSPGGRGLPPPTPSFPEVAGGFHGKLLRVNLTTRNVSIEKLSYQFCRQYVGGAGFVVHYLWKELATGIDPLGPDNKLVFALGPVSGLQLPGAARFCVGAKSPLTGTMAKAEAGGFWMAELKRAGYDVIIVEGKADKPTYLWIHDGVAEIKDAGRLWGMEAKETEEAIRTELGDEHVQAVMIGPAGENMVRYACVMCGLHDAAARGGVGAVMGSKNLKAIAARGHEAPTVADPDSLREIRQRMVARPHFISGTGTGGADMAMMEQAGNLPVRNFREGLFPEVNRIHAGVMKETLDFDMEGCYACPIRCKKMIKFAEPYKCDEAYGGPEYETIASLGSNCGVSDVKAICKANERCNAYSLDTISTGSTIAFAMECFENGLLTKEDTGGIELKFGNADAMLKVIDLIATRQGIGAPLAEGTARMAKKIGRGSEAFAMHAKGLEPGMHDPRAGFLSGLGIGYAVSPTGADHGFSIGGGTSPMGMEQFHPFGILAPLPDDLSQKRLSLYAMTHALTLVKDCMVMCIWPPCNYENQVELLKVVTGWDTGIMEMLKVGQRVLTLMRMFNLREGLTVNDDVLPERFYQPKTNGVLSNKFVDRAAMAQAMKYYYYFMGWDEDGVPRPERLAELGIA